MGRSGHSAVVPNQLETAELLEDRLDRLAPVKRGSRRPDGNGAGFGWIAALVATLVVVAGIGVLDSSGDQAPAAVASQSLAVTATLTIPPVEEPTMRPAELACDEGRLEMTAGRFGRGDYGALAPAQPPGTRLLLALELSPTEGRIIVAGTADAEVIATFKAADILPDVGVRAIDATATQMLFMSDYFPTTEPSLPELMCTALWVIDVGGVATELVSFRGETRVVDAGFAPDGSAWFVADSLLNLTNGSVPIPIAPCEYGPTQLAWSPQGRRVALRCVETDLVVVDTRTREVTRANFGDVGLLPLAFRWLDDDTILLAGGDGSLVGRPGPVRFLTVETDGPELAWTERAASKPAAEWFLYGASLSSDARTLLAQGYDGIAGDATFVIDTRSGKTVRLPFTTPLESFPPPPTTWLPGPGKRVLIEDGRILYVVDLVDLTREAVGQVPASDFVVLLPETFPE